MKIKTFFAIGLLVAQQICFADLLSDAKATTDAYLHAIRIVEVPDGKAELARHGWGGVFPLFTPSQLPAIKETTTLFEGVFDTDVPTITGYKRLIQATVVSQGPTRLEQLLNKPGTPAGALKDEKYMAVAYMDQSSKKWRVYSLGPAADTAREVASAREWTTKADRTQPKFKYRTLAQWLILDGKLAEAREAIAKSKQLASSTTPDDELTQRLASAGSSEAAEAFRQSARSSDAALLQALPQFEALLAAISTQVPQAQK